MLAEVFLDGDKNQVFRYHPEDRTKIQMKAEATLTSFLIIFETEVRKKWA